MIARENEKIALFIDGDNLFGTLGLLHWHIDFIRFKELLVADSTIYNCFYYTSWDNDPSKKNFSIFMINNGFTIRKRDQLNIKKDNVVVNTKGDADVLMVMDLILTRDNYDIAVLVTGDSDFVPVVDYLRAQGKRIAVVSSKFESASIELVNACDIFIDLGEIRDIIERKYGEDKNER